MEAGADLQHRGHTAVQVDITGAGGRDVGQQLEQCGFARAVGADDTHGLALFDGEADAVQRHKCSTDQSLVGADQAVRVLFAALAGPPALQVTAQRAAADLAQAVLLFDVLHTDHQFIFTHVRTPLHRIDEGLFDLAEKRQTHDQQHGGPGQRKHPH